MKKLGFTLIELLAVIVILAVIMLIATPTILNVIEDSRKGAFKNAAYGLIKSAEQEYMEIELKSNDEIKNLVFEYENGKIKGDKDLDYKGSRPESGKVIITQEGKIALALHNGTYCVEKGYDDAEVTLSEKIKEKCEIPLPSFPCGENLVDTRDGEIYKTVKIGNQCWVAENLRYTGNGCLSNTWVNGSPYNACRVTLGEMNYQWMAAMNGSTIEGS